MMSHIPYLVWLFVSAGFFAIGEVLSKRFAHGPTVTGLLVLLVVYSCGTLAWLPALLQKNTLTITGTLWSVLSLLMTVAIGILGFQEPITPRVLVGILLACATVVCLSAG